MTNQTRGRESRSSRPNDALLARRYLVPPVINPQRSAQSTTPTLPSFDIRHLFPTTPHHFLISTALLFWLSVFVGTTLSTDEVDQRCFDGGTRWFGRVRDDSSWVEEPTWLCYGQHKAGGRGRTRWLDKRTTFQVVNVWYPEPPQCTPWIAQSEGKVPCCARWAGR